MNVLDPAHRARCREHLRELLAAPCGLDLIAAALLVSAEEDAAVDVATQRARVDSIADEAARRARDLDNAFARYDAVRSYIFDELGFRGDTEHYDDPANSYLDRVLDRRTGIPLTLAILLVACLERSGFRAVAAGLPGHVVVRVEFEGRRFHVDPFHGGEVVTEEDCRRLVSRATGRPSLFRRHQLEGSTAHALFGRMLLNLKRNHLAREDFARALAVVERLLLLRPDDAREIRDRGILMAHLGRPRAAVADLETYLARVPQAPDADSVRGRLAWLRRRMTELR